MSQTRNSGVPLYEDTEDEKLMVLYVQGDEAAFNELFLRYKGRVYAYLSKRVSDPRKADDVFQEAFLKLHRSRILYDSKRLFSAWIFSITRNAIRDHLRQKRRNPATLGVDVETISGSDETVSAEIQLESVLKKISQKEREAIQLRFDKNIGFEEIGKLLGTSEGNVRQIVSRGLRKIRKAFR